MTDILHYGSSSYPDDIDETVKKLAASPKFAEVRDRVAQVLGDEWPTWKNVEPDLAKVRRALQEVEGRLQA